MMTNVGFGSSNRMSYDPAEMFRYRPSASSRNAERPSVALPSGGTGLSEGERSVLAQERALRASAGGAKTATTYTYEIGPDGKRYIVGAEVSITGTEDELDSIPGGRKNIGPAESGNSNEEKDSSNTGEKSESAEDDPEVRAAVSELQNIEREVIAHEAAHMATGGQFAGGVSYSYTTGPDGKKYITGGEVPISTPSTDNPEEALKNAEQVMKAALAPARPSSQDSAVAANAAQIAAEARAQMAVEKSKDANPIGSDEEKTVDTYTSQKAKDAYAANASKNGLWIAPTADDAQEEQSAAAA